MFPTGASPSDRDESENPELLIAGGRFLLATTSLAAIYIDPTEPTRFASLAYGLLILYTLHSLAVVVAILRFKVRPGKWFIYGTHAVDLLWPALISLFTEGPNSPFYIFYLWVLLAAAYRWDLIRTMITAGISIGLLVAEAVFLAVSPASHLMDSNYEVNRLIMRAVYLLVMAVAVGYVADRQKQDRRAASVITNLIAKARMDWGISRSLQAVVAEITGDFQAKAAILVCRSRRGGQTTSLKVSASTPTQPKWEDVNAALAGQCFEAVDDARAEVSVPVHDPGITYLPKQAAQGTMDWDLVFGPECAAALVAVAPDMADWQVRLFLLDPAYHKPLALRSLRRIMVQVSPALYNVYLVHRLRARAEKVERSRLARELHDGTMQSLFAMRLQLGALRRRHSLSEEVSGDIDRIQHLLRTEMVELRGLMQRMTDADVEPDQLLEVLANTVEKFDKESGMAATFVAHCASMALPARACRELVRITEEALINVQKHAFAKHVAVDLRETHGIYLFTVKDDGRGFDFDGRLTAEQMDAANKGPKVIRRRAESIGARLTVESKPGRGSTIELILVSGAGSQAYA